MKEFVKEIGRIAKNFFLLFFGHWYSVFVLFSWVFFFGFGYYYSLASNSVEDKFDRFAALKGCELVASSINKQLDECEYHNSYYKNKLFEAGDRLRNCGEELLQCQLNTETQCSQE